MDDRAVRPRAADGFKADITQSIGIAPEGFQFCDHIDFGQTALGGRIIQPGQKIHHRHPVTQMRRAGASNFGGVFAGFGQDAGIGFGLHLDARAL